MKIKKFMSLAAAFSLSFALSACGGNTDTAKTEDATNEVAVEETVEEETQETAEEAESTENEASEEAAATDGEPVKVTMVTDFGGVNDKSFNQSAYEGLQAGEADGKVEFDYIESQKEADYAPNLESAIDSESDIILTVGYALFKETDKAAVENTDQNYVIIDSMNINERENLLGVGFADHQNSFMVGYIAGMTTETNNVGFVGGVSGEILDRFEFGYRAGVEYAAREKGEDIKVQVQYANSFNDQAAGKNIADRMYQKGADVVFHAAGGVGIGVFEAAKENNKWVIGVDRDQTDEAPDHILVSTIKGVGDAVQLIIDEYAESGFKAGDKRYTLEDGDAVTIAYPTTNNIVSQETKDKVEKIRQQIIDGEIEVPENKEQAEAQGYTVE